jgi:hypothetical protein
VSFDEEKDETGKDEYEDSYELVLGSEESTGSSFNI